MVTRPSSSSAAAWVCGVPNVVTARLAALTEADVMAMHEATEKLRRQAGGEDEGESALQEGEPQQEEVPAAWTEDIPPRRPGKPRGGRSR